MHALFIVALATFFVFWIKFLISEAKIHKSMGKTSSHIAPGLPEPFEVLQKDYRVLEETKENSNRIRAITWNIERGYKLDQIIAELKKIDADIIILQELDIMCKRTDNLDVPNEIGKALKLNMAFVPEFHEFESPIRPSSNQGGGVHGNAILTKFDFLKVEAIIHKQQINWRLDGLRFCGEPRKGGRVTLVAEIATPTGVIVTYSSHLEPFVTCTDRFENVKEILQSCFEYCQKAKGTSSSSSSASSIDSLNSQTIRGFLIGGDFNTMLSGIGRLNFYLPWNSSKNILGRIHHPFQTEAQCLAHRVSKELKELSKKGASDTLLSLTDPFDKSGKTEWTLSNYQGKFQHKLDFLFYSASSFALREKNIGTGNESDHQWISVDLEAK
ncbi:uncharacterized protein MONOS_1770 [Monocercomonoides exilis]|uniref:uncharacterized protein n=1 Tax=Monocercomonoides exilis TaxID=2049356 RepID=UPI003559D5D5|nr:hypothetical protein MONOS_1770 [Monocercomonoides exilis]|eukprot:MONOS_1770.1-p1 / transcript=MONOS_1770.1 / gene=MONOS_1770 / organism=Monocercomonoides_exilis_PA203 / gene_product=unspecified product / transcript_product=unspecified product / location=Mono_scaffold00033:54308-55711(+) / protein_length=384 / sequence_SO=supercontig / SO=protein_coding / is_pseudo=false